MDRLVHMQVAKEGRVACGEHYLSVRFASVDVQAVSCMACLWASLAVSLANADIVAARARIVAAMPAEDREVPRG